MKSNIEILGTEHQSLSDANACIRDPETGSDTKAYLKNTNESVHASVRYRYKAQLRSAQISLGSSDSTKFELPNYELDDHRPFKWTPTKETEIPTITERELGKYEQVLLALYDRKFPGTWKEVTETEYVPSSLTSLALPRVRSQTDSLAYHPISISPQIACKYSPPASQLPPHTFILSYLIPVAMFQGAPTPPTKKNIYTVFSRDCFVIS